MTQLGPKPTLAGNLLSSTLALSIPLILGAYWILYAAKPDAAVLILRPAVLGASVLLALLWYRAPATLAERRLAGLLSIFCGALIIPSLAATDPVRALADWLKLALLCLVCLLLCRALRNESNARIFGWSLVFCGALLSIFILLVYVKFMGFAIPTYKSAREFKGITEKAGIPLNAVPFSSVFAYAAGMCLLRGNKFLWLLGSALFFVSSVFTGSRAPLGALALSGLALFAFKAIRSRHLFIRLSAWTTITVFSVGVAALIWHLSFKQMSSITEGRWDLWSVACQKFIERPIFGYGFESWRDDLVSRLPGEYALTGAIAINIAGGYHNEYLAMLAEQGLIGFVPLIVFFGFLLRSCRRLAFANWNTWRRGSWALFACLFLLVRAGVEMPGLFGYGNEPADYLAYIFVAIVISRFSIEEDFLRARSRALNAPGVTPFGTLPRQTWAAQN